MKRVWITLVLLLPNVAAATPQFFGLGDLPAPYTSSGLLQVSDSGRAGGGMYDLEARSFQAIVYASTSGLQSFVDLPGGSSDAMVVTGGSRDGTTLVGRVRSEGDVLSFRYRENSGVVALPGRPGITTHQVWAHDFASDADLVVGTAAGIAAIWDADLDLRLLGGLNAAFPHSYGYGISADGTRVVGKSWNDVFRFQAFLWTEDSGMIAIAPSAPAPSPHYSEADAISADGTTVIGVMTGVEGGMVPFVWDALGGMRSLAAPSGYTWYSTADSYSSLDVTADGSIIVGDGLHFSDDPNHAFIYTEAGGARPLSDYLTSLGMDLGGWVLESANGISENGRYIVGSGIDPAGRARGWLVDLPEPATGLLIWTGVLGLVFAQRQKRRSDTATPRSA